MPESWNEYQGEGPHRTAGGTLTHDKSSTGRVCHNMRRLSVRPCRLKRCGTASKGCFFQAWGAERVRFSSFVQNARCEGPCRSFVFLCHFLHHIWRRLISGSVQGRISCGILWPFSFSCFHAVLWLDLLTVLEKSLWEAAGYCSAHWSAMTSP